MARQKISVDTQLNIVDATSVIGSATESLNNTFYIDENGLRTSMRGQMAQSRRLRASTSALPFSQSSSVTSSVWTYTITDTSGIGRMVFNINQKVIVTPVGTSSLSVNLTSLSGTNLNPKTIYIYVIDNAGVPQLTASNTDPEGVVNHVTISFIVAGTISSSSVTIYAKQDYYIDPLEFIHEMFHFVADMGAIYKSGMAPTATTTNVSIASGVANILLSDISTSALNVNTNGILYIKSDGTYNTSTDFSFGGVYSTGETITSNRYFNVTIGLIIYNGAARILGLVQKGNAEYSTASAAYSDVSQTLVKYPSQSLLLQSFIRIGRIIVQRVTSTYTLQDIPPGAAVLYIEDLRNVRS